MNFCKQQIFVNKLSDDEAADLRSRLRSGTIRLYTGTIAEQAAMKAFFQEFVIASDEELSAFVSCDQSTTESTESKSFIFILGEDYERVTCDQ